MNSFRKLASIMAIAMAITACNSGERTKTDKVEPKTQTVGEANKVDINQAMEGMPKFSSAEIQNSAQEWFTTFGNGMKEAQQKAILANGDQVKVKEIAAEMTKKFAPWKEKIQELKTRMTTEDRKLFDDYGTKIANDLVAQAQKKQ